MSSDAHIDMMNDLPPSDHESDTDYYDTECSKCHCGLYYYENFQQCPTDNCDLILCRACAEHDTHTHDEEHPKLPPCDCHLHGGCDPNFSDEYNAECFNCHKLLILKDKFKYCNNDDECYYSICRDCEHIAKPHTHGGITVELDDI